MVSLPKCGNKVLCVSICGKLVAQKSLLFKKNKETQKTNDLKFNALFK